ncbi:MAG: aminotransferase class I/II-fold pyridoxal phosphate-dependent enzyme [Flavobacteriales bacterium]|nr:aminotransferase class I/II-fold pyridoxal phosphate-dependent enzyme [Flavobacteriales bacterium]
MNKQKKYLQQQIDKRKQENAFRELKDNNHLIDFCSNDYLGFAKETAIHQTNQQLESYGATGSRLISGNHTITEETEDYLANFYRSEAALIFNSGYSANVGLFQCLPQRNDTVIYDEYIHASIRDGIKLCNAKHFAFEHNNLAALEEKLSLASSLVYVVVESIYSMDGDAAPLVEIAKICKQYHAALIVDEAHAAGIYGKGLGLVAELNLENDVFARIITFGKAYGCHGAAVLGSNILRDYLINYSRAFIYTTALPLPSILAIKNAHEFLLKNLNRIDELKALIAYFKNSTSNFQLLTSNSISAIQCIIIPGNNEVKKVAENIQKNGFDVRPILSPTVPKGKERLRICLHSFNTKDEIDRLITQLNPSTTEGTLPLRGIGGVTSNNLHNKKLKPLAHEGKTINHPPYPPSREETMAKKSTTEKTSPLEGRQRGVTSNNLYNKKLKTLARNNRKEMTKAEAKIWNNLLRKNQCFGLRFLRQRPILDYIVDFMCPELKLIVEIDGYSHQFEHVYENDVIRQKTLESSGYRFLRFTDDEVMNDFNNVIRTFEIYLENIKK